MGEQREESERIDQRSVLPVEEAPPLSEVEEVNDVDIDTVDAGEPKFKKLGKPSPGDVPVKDRKYKRSFDDETKVSPVSKRLDFGWK